MVFHASDVDALHAQAFASGLQPDTAPRHAGRGERFLYLTDPDGPELSFVRLLF